MFAYIILEIGSSYDNYAIVETENKDNEVEVSIVSETWLNKGFVFWPLSKNATLHVKEKTKPTSKWQTYPKGELIASK